MNRIDRDTRRAFRTASERFSKPYFGDYDRDGVPNILDCQPTNRHKQGFFHDWMERRKQSKEERDLEGDVPVDEGGDFVYAENDVNEEPMKGAEPTSNFLPIEAPKRKPKNNKDHFFDNNDNINVYDPQEYLIQRYGMSKEEARNVVFKETLMWNKDNEGVRGVDKSQLDAIAQSSYLRDEHTEETKEPEEEEEPSDTDDLMDKTFDSMKKEGMFKPVKKETKEDVPLKKGVHPENPEGFYNPQKKGRLGGAEGEIYLYIKTEPNAYSLFGTPFNSRVEASRYAEENFKGSKFVTMSREEIKDYTSKQQEEKQKLGSGGQQGERTTKSSDVLKSMLDQSEQKARREGLTAPQLGGSPMRGPMPMYRSPSYSMSPQPMERQQPRGTPGIASGILRKPRPQLQYNVGKKVLKTPVNAPFAQYAGPRFHQPSAPRGRPYQKQPKSKYMINTEFKLYRPPIYGSRSGSTKIQNPLTQKNTSKKTKGGNKFMAKKKSKRTKRKKK